MNSQKLLKCSFIFDGRCKRCRPIEQEQGDAHSFCARQCQAHDGGKNLCLCISVCLCVCVPLCLCVCVSVYMIYRSVSDISESSHILTPVCACGHWLDYYVLKLNLFLCPLWTSCDLMEKASLLCPCCIARLPFFPNARN